MTERTKGKKVYLPIKKIYFEEDISLDSGKIDSDVICHLGFICCKSNSEICAEEFCDLDFSLDSEEKISDIRNFSREVRRVIDNSQTVKKLEREIVALCSSYKVVVVCDPFRSEEDKLKSFRAMTPCRCFVSLKKVKK